MKVCCDWQQAQSIHEALIPAAYLSQLANNVRESPAYADGGGADGGGGGGFRDDGPTGGDEDAGYSPTGMHGNDGGGGGGGGGEGGQQDREEQEEREDQEERLRRSSSWSTVPESGGGGGAAARGPRSRGRRDKWEIGDRYRVSRLVSFAVYGLLPAAVPPTSLVLAVGVC